MSEHTLNIYAYEVFVDREKYLAVPRLFQNTACVQISLDRSWNENDITSALVAKDGKVIEATRLIVRNDHEDNEHINCADDAVTNETQLLFQRFRRITDTVLACDPVFVAVPHSGVSFLDLPNLPKKTLAVQPLALRSEIHITGIRAAHP